MKEYAGLRPVAGHGSHAYAFQLFALDRILALGPLFSRREVAVSHAGAVTAKGRLDGTCDR